MSLENPFNIAARAIKTELMSAHQAGFLDGLASAEKVIEDRAAIYGTSLKRPEIANALHDAAAFIRHSAATLRAESAAKADGREGEG